MRPNPLNCLHMMIERVKEKVDTLDINGHGTLRPAFKCGECHCLFYFIVPSGKQKKPKLL